MGKCSFIYTRPGENMEWFISDTWFTQLFYNRLGFNGSFTSGDNLRNSLEILHCYIVPEPALCLREWSRIGSSILCKVFQNWQHNI